MIRPIQRCRSVIVLVALLFTAVHAGTILENARVTALDTTQIEQQLHQCAVVQALDAQKAQSAQPNESIVAQLFTVLFPSSSPAINALLATLYISGPPNLLLALCPPNIDPSSLSIMVAFAVGGLLGDTLFHLLPEIFLGEDEPDRVRFVMLEPNRNLLLGVGILVGIATFMAMDKAIRIATGGSAHSHEHGEKHDHASSNGTITFSTSLDSKNGNGELRKRGPNSPSTTSGTTHNSSPPGTSSSPSSHSGLLNLFADFTHNITDGLALSTSFYSSPTLGATTALAIFFHEIPHEVGDFALLIQSGFSKRQAMAAQFMTALGALLGCVIGIGVREFGGANAVADTDGGLSGSTQGIFGTSLQWADMLLPFTAGTFLYVGTVAVIPELLEVKTDVGAKQELWRTAQQFLAMATGAGIMLAISWS